MTGAKKLIFFFIGCILFCCSELSAQKKEPSARKNSTIKKDTAVVQKDTVVKLKFRPQVATRRAAILPGWGQATN